MGTNWQSIDSNFPTFTEDESPYVQIQKLTDYMFQLVESLKYSLGNLDADNWNSAGLKQFSTELTGDLEKDLQAYGEALNRIQTAFSGISTKVTAQEQRLANLQTKLEEVKTAADRQAQTAQTWNEEIRAMLFKLNTNVERIQQALSGLFLWLRPEEDHLILGYEGGRLDLVGNVYVNKEEQS